jgi:hypothetical protein
MILHLEQGSEDWLKYRESKVTATDFSSIARRENLIRYAYAKVGIDTHLKHKKKRGGGNLAMAKGTEYEPIIMTELLKINPCLENLVIVQGNNLASYDAVDVFSGAIDEIKTSSTTLENIQELIPAYVCQVAHQAYILSDELCMSTSDMDLKIYLLRFCTEDGIEKLEWHITIIKISDVGIEFECKTLGVWGRLDLNKSKWLRFCNNFYKHIEKDNA